MSANIIIGKRKILNARPGSEEIINCYLIFYKILKKTAMLWITENHFLFVGLSIGEMLKLKLYRYPGIVFFFLHWWNPRLENLIPSHPQ